MYEQGVKSVPVLFENRTITIQYDIHIDSTSIWIYVPTDSRVVLLA